MTAAYTPVTRSELADFIEDALTNDPDLAQWDRVIVNHFHDPIMEAARVEFVRLFAIRANAVRNNLTPANIDNLEAVAASLR